MRDYAFATYWTGTMATAITQKHLMTIVSVSLGAMLFATALPCLADPIGPEAVRDMQNDATQAQRSEIVSFDDSPDAHRMAPDPKHFPKDVNLIYACWSLSQRRCKDAVLSAQSAGHEQAFYLTGTPQEWVSIGLKFSDYPADTLKAKLAALSLITVKDLASARKDGTEFTLIDVRSGLKDSDTKIDGAIAMPPVLISEKRAMLPKKGWIVLYDGGNHVADSSAAELRQAGFPMAVTLAGGYPAWVSSDQR
jgi:rhodanese-related sulfurtransferase